MIIVPSSKLQDFLSTPDDGDDVTTIFHQNQSYFLSFAASLPS